MNWRPTTTIEVLQQRAEILHRVRQFFNARGFFEVQTPCLSRDVVVDRYIEPIPVELETARGRERLWLQTSPEFAMKRLLAAGADAIYQIGPVFRAGEAGPRHNPEFTMLEWYRTGDGYRKGMDLLDEFAQAILACPPTVRMTYREAFLELAGIDPFAPGTDAGQLNQLMAESIEPGLQLRYPSAIICDWPADHAALARTRTTDEGQLVAERFELFVNGIELANGYHELIDAAELLARNRKVNALRRSDGRQELPEEAELLAAMCEGLPPCSGVALGLDRLVMMVLGKEQISEVMAFPFSRC